MDNYKTLEKVFYKLSDIERIQAVLGWDTAVTMPNGGAENRAEQLATLKGLYHAIITDEGIGEMLDNSKKEYKKLNPWQKSNLSLMKKQYDHAVSVPKNLLVELSKAGTKCEMAWRKARAENDFKALLPHLKNVVSLVREVAKAKSAALKCSPYDALLDQYDPGRKSAQLDSIFNNLKEFLPKFIEEVVEKQKSAGVATPIKGKFPVENQKALGVKMLEMLNFNFEKGRFDESHHPFCGGYPGDIRITTRYNEDNFLPSFMGVLHEGGHAMYEAGLPSAWQRQPVGNAMGMAIHESQSLIIEMQACRSIEFFKFALPLIKKEFGTKGKAWNIDNVIQVYRRVEPSLIRVDADEVTYPAHIMLRYYLERYLIDGDMEVEDLPEAWKQGMEKFLGVKPDSDANGCMQDIHWMDGTFGYFPTYTLGAIYAAQLFKAAQKDNADLLPSIERGDFKPLISWLNKNIHEKGSKESSDELIKSATGSELDIEVYKQHLKERYLEQA